MAFFARVVEMGSFSDAARSLGLSKSAVSARVARLERDLGVRLLHRTTRRLALTADGVRLYEQCARLVATANEARDLAAGARAVPHGSLRIYLPAALAEVLLAAPIATYLREYPDVRMELSAGLGVPDFTRERFDVAVAVTRNVRETGLVIRKLGDTRVVVCASPAYLRERGIPFRPQELVHHARIALRLAADDWLFDTDEGPMPMAPDPCLVVDDVRVLRQAALDGLGVAALPELFVAEALADGRLVRVLDDYHAIELTVLAVHPHARLVPARLRMFLDTLASHAKNVHWRPLSMVSEGALPPTRSRSSKRKDETGTTRVPMTEQDVRRLQAVADLFARVDASGAERLRARVTSTRVVPASKMPRDTVTMNSRVACTDAGGRVREVVLAYPWDARDNRISVLDPLGVAMLGASVGNRVKGGREALQIDSVPYQPEAAGDHHL